MNEQLWKYVRGVMWDYESIPDNVEFVERPDLLMYKTKGSASILSNKIAKVDVETDDDFKRICDEMEVFYKEKPFSWWIGPDSKPKDLALKVESLGLEHEDTYYGLIKAVDRWEKVDLPFSVQNVTEEEDVRHCVEVSGQVWEYDDATKETLISQRLEYLKDPRCRGGFLIVMDGDCAVGYAGYRFSSDGEAMYLAGTGVLPEYRGQGIYRALLSRRMELASSFGSNWIVTQARKGTSEPILRKLGFENLGRYEVFTNR